MVLTIRDHVIYDRDGVALKRIQCPRTAETSDLSIGQGDDFECRFCSEEVVNTDVLSEDDIVSLLRAAPNTCLYINLANPIFRVYNQ